MLWKRMNDPTHLSDMGVGWAEVINWGHANEQWSTARRQKNWLRGQGGRREEGDSNILSPLW